MSDKSQLDNALSFVLSKIAVKPVVGIVLGSGLGDFADTLKDQTAIPTQTIPHYPIPTVQGHEGRLVFGYLQEDHRKSLPLLVFKGRVHYYETVDLNAVLFPIRLAGALGLRYLVLTNAAGGIGRHLAPGDLMLINDLLNFTFLYPQAFLQASGVSPLSVRKQANPFDKELQDLLRASAVQEGIALKEGTYCWLRGPSYETKAEVEMLRRMGVDAVGMSTVPEVDVANELGLKVAALSLISNLAAGISAQKLAHEEVTETAGRIKETLRRLLQRMVMQLRF